MDGSGKVRSAWPGAATLALLAGCAETPEPAPPPTPAPPVVRQASLPPPASPAPPDWRDIPLTPGGWAYAEAGGGSQASFGAAGFVLRCDFAQRRILLTRQGATGPLTVRTSYEARAVAGPLAASDPLLDRIAFSRGRFTVEAPGLATLVVPAWPEPARVIEDCRG